MIDYRPRPYYPRGLARVHSLVDCAGRPCVIHAPSDHHMRTWRTVWRGDRRMMERTCRHGVGHPDPDDLAYRLTFPGRVDECDAGVHGCDGCCAPRTGLRRWVSWWRRG